MPFDTIASEKIEILGLDIFDTHREEIETVEKFREHFDAALGWHYYLDIAWILKEVKELPKGSLLLDAGAGSGIMQFILSELGYNVISADFMGRDFSQGYASRYESLIHTLNSQKNSIHNSYTSHLKTVYSSRGNGILGKISNLFREAEQAVFPISCLNDYRFTPEAEVSRSGKGAESFGRIFLYKSDIADMKLIPDGIVDGVVSVSALEHNNHAGFKKCVTELLRVTKPSGRMLVTVSASQSEDWFHEPSKGWCYSEKTLKELFMLGEQTCSNYKYKDELYLRLKTEGNELHKRLSRVYYDSGDNGMPWGIWDPKYQPVGVIKVKK